MDISEYWKDLNTTFQGDSLFANGVVSLLFICVLVAVRFALVSLLRSRANFSIETRRRWLVNIRNAIIFLLVAGLTLIWAAQLQTLALSMVAIAVAIVIATKELILCFSGAAYRAGSNAFSVGDCIEVKGVRGDVIDQDLFSTTIMELGPGPGTRQYTGRAVVLPNSLLLSETVVSESYMGDYVVHFITIPISVHENWREAERVLLAAAEAECAPFIQKADAHMKQLAKRQWIDTPTAKPRVTIYFHTRDELRLLLRVPAPQRRKGRIEQAIMRRFLSEFQFTQPAALPGHVGDPNSE